MTKDGNFTIDTDQIVHLDGRELFRHGAPHSGAWSELAKENLEAKDIKVAGVREETMRLSMAYQKFLIAQPAVEIPGKYPIAWFQENATRNGMRIANLPWKSDEYHRALRDPRYMTEALIPVDYGATVDERVANERMQAVRDENGNVVVRHQGTTLENIDIGPMTGSIVVSEDLRKSVIERGYLPETFMTMKNWTKVPPEILPVLVAMGVHKAKSWGMLVSQVSPDMLRVMVLHRDQFAAWPGLEPDRDAIRESALVLMLKIQKDPEGAKTFNDYYNAGGTTRGLVEQNIDTVRKLRSAIVLMDVVNATAAGNKKNMVPTTYCPPAIETPQGVVWADANTFPMLSDMYGNCISKAAHSYSGRVAAGEAHVLYRTHRGQDEQGRHGGMCCFISYVTDRDGGVKSWRVYEIKSYRNGTVHQEYLLEAQSIVDRMNENPKAYKNLFRSEVKRDYKSGETPTFTVEALRTTMPKSLIWANGLSLAVLNSLDRNRTAKNANNAQPAVRRMRSALIS